jgi:adenine deaminase
MKKVPFRNLKQDKAANRVYRRLQGKALNGAELLGWSSAVGEIAPGQFADIIALSADPLEDVTSLEHVDFVMKGAAVVRNEFAKHEVTRSDSPNGHQH